ncbi:signal peptidase I [Granulicella arctica]|uniref:signal peptidase I n=1 Tax=Granulicella arctica TaxID=940613 RepID=UPI0021E00AAD|nr:signal peptidase I [Granulicella arctica]
MSTKAVQIATDTPDTQPAKVVAQEQVETPLEGFASICNMLVVYLFLTAFIFQNFDIPSASMEKTLLIGDHPLVDRIMLAPPTKWAFFMPYREIHRGDVIVFLKPNPETPDLILVKRAIGIPGDRIHLRNGIVYLNGVAQDEPQAGKPSNDGDPYHAYNPYRDDFPSIAPSTDVGATESWSVEEPSHIQGDDLVVPPGKVFAMGDNRTASLDGRYWGFVPRENILGRPLFLYWSFKTPADQMNKTSIADRVTFTFHELIHIFDQTRWNRTMKVVR